MKVGDMICVVNFHDSQSRRTVLRFMLNDAVVVWFNARSLLRAFLMMFLLLFYLLGC